MRRLLTLAVLLVACGSLDARRVAREPIVTADLTGPVADAISRDFSKRFQAHVYGAWSIPGKSDHHLVFANPPAIEGQPYGPRIYVIRHRSGHIDVLHEGERMMDADYLDPSFFGDERFVLLLADFGSEDSWGLAAIHIGDGVIRDLGTIEVMRSEGPSGFTGSAIPAARVFVENGKYIIAFEGEVLDASDVEKRLAKSGERAVFVEDGERFRYVGPVRITKTR